MLTKHVACDDECEMNGGKKEEDFYSYELFITKRMENCMPHNFFFLHLRYKKKRKKIKKVEMSKNLIKIIRQSKFPDKLSCQLK